MAKLSNILPLSKPAVYQSQDYQIHGQSCGQGTTYYNAIQPSSILSGPVPSVEILQSHDLQIPAPRSMGIMYRELLLLKSSILNLEREFIIAQQTYTNSSGHVANNSSIGGNSTITWPGFTVGIKRESTSSTADESSIETVIDFAFGANTFYTCPGKADNNAQRIDEFFSEKSSFKTTDCPISVVAELSVNSTTINYLTEARASQSAESSPTDATMPVLSSKAIVSNMNPHDLNIFN